MHSHDPPCSRVFSAAAACPVGTAYCRAPYSRTRPCFAAMPADAMQAARLWAIWTTCLCPPPARDDGTLCGCLRPMRAYDTHASPRPTTFARTHPSPSCFLCRRQALHGQHSCGLCGLCGLCDCVCGTVSLILRVRGPMNARSRECHGGRRCQGLHPDPDQGLHPVAHGGHGRHRGGALLR